MVVLSFIFLCAVLCFFWVCFILGGVVAVLGVYLFFEKEFKFGCVGRGDDLQRIGGREEYYQNILKVKNSLK